MNDRGSRNWCGTWFRQQDDVRPTLDLIKECPATVDYAIVGHEICPATGNAHDQIFIKFKNAIRLSFLTRNFPGAHWEKAKGTAYQNFIYCSKGEGRKLDDGTYVDHGLNASFEECGSRPLENAREAGQQSMMSVDSFQLMITRLLYK